MTWSFLSRWRSPGTHTPAGKSPPPLPTLLCDVCTSMFQSKTRDGKHHSSWRRLKRAADQHCYICIGMYLDFHKVEQTLSRANITFSYNAPPIEPISSVDEDEEYVDDCVQRFYIAVSEDLVPGLSHVVSLYPSTAEKHLYVGEAFTYSKVLPSQTKDALPLASTWLHQCQSHHSSCGSNRNNTWRPKRLVHHSRGLVHVVDTELELTCGSYAALSHCWGPKPGFLVLTADNAHRLKNGVPCSSLPQNFQDALFVIEKLGIKYLWIDSLCILQSGPGSLDDWQLHASAMADVYTNCEVNIATHNAQTPLDRGLSKKRRRLVESPGIRWHNFGDEDLICETYDSYLDSHTSAGLSTLSRRAWVFQERRLSPRILHLGADQICWECNELPLASETRPLGMPKFVRGTRPLRLEPPAARPKRDSDGHTLYPVPLGDRWNLAVQEYSACLLSFPQKDKLVALAGIAQRMSELCNDDYAAGFFKSDILWHLPWSRASPQTKCWDGPYIAPTWSWLSMDGPISLPLWFVEKWELLATVVSLETTPLDPRNPWGQISAAKLTLNAPLLPSTVAIDGFPSQGPIDMTIIFTPHHQICGSFFPDPANNNHPLSPDNLFAIPLAENHDQEDFIIKCLVVQSCPNTAIFRRVGLIDFASLSRKDLTAMEALRCDIELM